MVDKHVRYGGGDAEDPRGQRENQTAQQRGDSAAVVGNSVSSR